jgi:hypothetical protein
MRYLKLIAKLSICVLIPACGKQSALLPDSIVINVNNCTSTKINSQNITVCLDSVLNDSRCPDGVECIWAGVAYCRFKATLNNNAYNFTLETLVAQNNDTTINGYKFILDSLVPYPSIISPHSYTDYKAFITIRRSP